MVWTRQESDLTWREKGGSGMLADVATLVAFQADIG